MNQRINRSRGRGRGRGTKRPNTFNQNQNYPNKRGRGSKYPYHNTNQRMRPNFTTNRNRQHTTPNVNTVQKITIQNDQATSKLLAPVLIQKKTVQKPDSTNDITKLIQTKVVDTDTENVEIFQLKSKALQSLEINTKKKMEKSKTDAELQNKLRKEKLLSIHQKKEKSKSPTTKLKKVTKKPTEALTTVDIKVPEKPKPKPVPVPKKENSAPAKIAIPPASQTVDNGDNKQVVIKAQTNLGPVKEESSKTNTDVNINQVIAETKSEMTEEKKVVPKIIAPKSVPKKIVKKKKKVVVRQQNDNDLKKTNVVQKKKLGPKLIKKKKPEEKPLKLTEVKNIAVPTVANEKVEENKEEVEKVVEKTAGYKNVEEKKVEEKKDIYIPLTIQLDRYPIMRTLYETNRKVDDLDDAELDALSAENDQYTEDLEVDIQMHCQEEGIEYKDYFKLTPEQSEEFADTILKICDWYLDKCREEKWAFRK